MKKRYLKAQTILEILIAASIIAMLLVSLVNLANYSLKNSTYAKKLDQATKLSYQLADWLRDQREELGWVGLTQLLQEDTQNNYVTYCFNTLPPSTDGFRQLSNSTCPPNSYILNTHFQRQATFDLSQLSNGIITVDITTSWQENQTYQAKLQIKLSQWN